ncbi:MAG TPA: single-stranded-DNA-specific exonuclease RecJ [Bacteroidales bacterium]|mgnify:FL=1|nr:single-stranded-DNA-specific exonuclease RecJ [Bacteroidales bacterium]HPS73118.1 single-stranded-DNA-specific exonuclease RecJ [Bacteroidales bacterium]
MEKHWVLKPQGDPETVKRIAGELNIDRYLATLLVQRGIRSYGEAKSFFRPKIEDLHDPFLMKDMDKAIERISRALQNGEKILVYGDYDVDGTTAVSLVYLFFRNYSGQIDYYIPDRYTEGYGISIRSIDFAAEQGFSLVIALDCGIKAVEKIQYANSKGIDFIICDHHRPGSTLPEACAVLDPKRSDCPYPYKELSGCGIGFKLIQAYGLKTGIDFDELRIYLDLVAVSIASDIVDMTGENRILAYFGLGLINTHPRPGIEAILQYGGIERSSSKGGLFFNKELTITDLVFLIGPRINAAGRIENGRNSVRLLISDNLEEARTIGRQIDLYNTERKNLDTLATQQALEMISNDPNLKNARSTVIFHPDWHKGVIGIVASRLTETYYRPTIVLTQANGLITGSARSVKDFDVYDAIDTCSDLLEHFGGHKFAAGLSLKPEKLDLFRKRFEETVAERLKGIELKPEIEVDVELPFSVINSKFFNIMKQFSPFGPGNMPPMFRTDGVIDAEGSRVVGKNHLKLNIAHPEIPGGPFAGIAFQQGEHIWKIEKKIPFNICYHLEENEWNGNKSLQLNVKDIRFD